MLPPPPVERLALPPSLPEPARAGFPVVASVAPVIVSLGIWAVTGSPYSLLFAALGPVVAVGSLLDGRRQRRRTARRDRERALATIARTSQRVDAIHQRERERLDRLVPSFERLVDPRRVVEQWSRELSRNAQGGSGGVGSGGPTIGAISRPVRLAVAEIAPVVELTGEPDDEAPAALRHAVEALRRLGSHVTDAPWLSEGLDGIGVLGPPTAARAVARSVTLQLLAQCSPASTGLTAPVGESWVAALPHRVRRTTENAFRVQLGLQRGAQEAVIAWAWSEDELPPGLGTIVRLETDGDGEVRDPVFVGVGASRARDVACALAAIASEHGVVDAAGPLPESVSLATLLAKPSAPSDSAGLAESSELAESSGLAESSELAELERAAWVGGGGLRAPVGVGLEGVVELDLVREGPHAVVAGTTGTGKSELLVSWVLAMATRHPPSVVTFLLIDFKGGAAFAPLAGVPHVVGIVSDLDVRRSRRAIESLRAELRRRERLLAERGARSIEELRGELARLVIVVDEFAAVVSGQPELHDVFSDLAARGRSLGLHLVLCTQRPSGVIRDGVLANVTLRISLRVTDRGDSTAMVGSEAAFALPPAPRGRAVIADGSGAVREVQLALAEPADAERLRVGPESSSDETPPGPMPINSRPARVWCDPLPELLRLEELRHDPEWSLARGIPFGRLDLPADQRQPLAVYDPAVDGHLLVLGAARGGRTTALATFAADPHCRVLPSEPADAWSVLDGLSSRPIRAGETVVLLIDDLDVLIDRFDPDARHDVVDRLTRLARESRQLRLIASAQRLTGPLQRLAGLFDARLLLRQPSRDEHVLAGGDGTSFDPRLPPGAGTWQGGASSAVTVQVAVCDRPLPVAGLPELPRVRLEQGTPLAIVAGRPRELLRRVAGTDGGIRVIRVGEQPTPDDAELRVTHGDPTLLLGDPDAWQAEWALLSSVRREFPLVFFGCVPSEVRAIARIREPPPPLGDRPGECWLVDGGGIRRAILEL